VAKAVLKLQADITKKSDVCFFVAVWIVKSVSDFLFWRVLALQDYLKNIAHDCGDIMPKSWTMV